MLIPLDQLPAETLHAIIEQFVLSEGTDYGESEVSLDQKVAQVHQQLINKEAFIVYSELHETVNIMSKDALAVFQQSAEGAHDNEGVQD